MTSKAVRETQKIKELTDIIMQTAEGIKSWDNVDNELLHEEVNEELWNVELNHAFYNKDENGQKVIYENASGRKSLMGVHFHYSDIITVRRSNDGKDYFVLFGEDSVELEDFFKEGGIHIFNGDELVEVIQDKDKRSSALYRLENAKDLIRQNPSNKERELKQIYEMLVSDEPARIQGKGFEAFNYGKDYSVFHNNGNRVISIDGSRHNKNYLSTTPEDEFPQNAGFKAVDMSEIMAHPAPVPRFDKVKMKVPFELGEVIDGALEPNGIKFDYRID